GHTGVARHRYPPWGYGRDATAHTMPHRGVSCHLFDAVVPSFFKNLLQKEALPPAWRRAVIDIPTRRHQHVRSVDETTTLRGDTGTIRQGAVAGLGPPHPTLFMSNNFDARARDLITRYAGRNGVEDS